MFRSFVILFSVTLVVSAGCGESGPEMYPVHGIVRFPDGKLLRHGTVEFELIDRENPITATGEIRPDGSFTMGTNDMDDEPAIVGKHRAVVISDHRIGNGFERPGLIPPPTLHPRFRDFLTAKLEFEVKEEANNIVIDVDYAPKGEEQEVTQ